MKRFMYFSVSVLCLSVAALVGFYIGSHRVEAQAQYDAQYFYAHESNTHYITAVLPNGDVYYNTHIGGPFQNQSGYVGNFWNGIVATDPSSMSEIKGMFKK